MEDLCTYNHPDPHTPGRTIPINFYPSEVARLIRGIKEAAGLNVPTVSDATDPIPSEAVMTLPEPPAKPPAKPKATGKH